MSVLNVVIVAIVVNVAIVIKVMVVGHVDVILVLLLIIVFCELIRASFYNVIELVLDWRLRIILLPRTAIGLNDH